MSVRNKNNTTQRTAHSPGPDKPGSRPACMVVIQGVGLGRRIDINHHPVIVGRSQDADLHLPHDSVSRRHCELWRSPGGEYRVRDLGSTNSTLVNDVAVDSAVLTDGDHLTVGECILKFIGDSSVEASYHKEVYQLATLDALTNLCNRRHFEELVDKEIARARRHGRHPVMCIIDVDLFKPINDHYGHVAGDTVLRQLAEIIRQQVRNEDTPARIGGEEFAVFFPESSLEEARLFAERLRETVAAATFHPSGEPRSITISLGLAALGDKDSRSSLMRAADAALYRAKNTGRNRVCVAGE